MLNVPAASAAPVPPAHTSACARPSATARAAITIDASGVARAALAGSAAFAIDTGASTTSTPAGGSPSSAAGPNRSTRAPRAAASAAPAATSAGPRSAPLQSTATTGLRPGRRRAPPTTRDCESAAEMVPGCQRPLASLPLVVIVVVVVLVHARRRRSRGPRRCRTRGHTRCGRRGLWHCGHSFTAGVPILCCARRLAVRLCDCFFLGTAIETEGYQDGDSHRCGSGLYSSFSSRSFAQRGSGAASWWCSGPASLRSAAHTGHSPAQSSRQSIFAGIASANASRAHAARSSVSSCTYGLSSSSPAAGRSTSRASTSTRGLGFLQAAHARARHAAAKREPQRVAAADHPRDLQLHRDARGLGRVALAAQRQRLDRHLQRQPAPLAGGQPQTGEVEVVGLRSHRVSG